MKEKAVVAEFSDNLGARNRRGALWHILFQASTIVGIVALIALLLNVINSAFGYVAYEAKVDPDTLAVDGVPLEGQSKEQLVALLQTELSRGAYNKLENEEPFAERSREEVLQVVVERIVRPQVVEVWNLWTSLTQADEIRATVAQDHPNAELDFISWLSTDFVTRPQTSEPFTAGVRTAILGSLWTILFTILLAFPIGVGAAIYLEEYASDNWLNRIIQTNINNLAGVPSIVYGILGLAIFVRALEPLTSGEVFGLVDPTTANGRTVLSAGLTLGLLVLPIIIINAQEAIRAVPRSIRNASFGVGATKWQTVWSHVLPNAMPGILTGTILAVSRAIGETAPLVVVGAFAYISYAPDGLDADYTALPMQIFQWTSSPQRAFLTNAAAGIVVLMFTLFLLNSIAIVLRNRFQKRM